MLASNGTFFPGQAGANGAESGAALVLTPHVLAQAAEHLVGRGTAPIPLAPGKKTPACPHGCNDAKCDLIDTLELILASVEARGVPGYFDALKRRSAAGQGSPERAAAEAEVQRLWDIAKERAAKHGIAQAADPVAAFVRAIGRRAVPNIGVATGTASGGACIVDVDAKKGKNGPAVLAALEAEYSPLPRSHAVQTPSGNGSMHIWLDCGTTPLPSTTDALGKGVDTRGDGGYAVVWPSVVDGNQYGRLPDGPLPAAPQWLLDKLTQPAHAHMDGTQPHMPGMGNADDLGAGVGRDWAYTGENVALVESMLRVLNADDRNFWRNICWAVESLKWGHGKELARTWSKTSAKFDESEFDKVWSDGDPDGAITIGTLIHHAQQAGWTWPRHHAAEDDPDAANDAGDTGANAGDASANSTDACSDDAQSGGAMAAVASSFPLSKAKGVEDLYNADLFARMFKGSLIYHPAERCWYKWDSERGVWRACMAGEEIERAKELARQMRVQAQAAYYKAPADPRVKDGLAHAKRTCQAKQIKAMVELARSDSRLQLPQGRQFNDDPWVLGVRNGAMDMRTGKLLPATPDLFITRQANAAALEVSNPKEDCPTFLKFLTEVFVDEAGKTDLPIARFVLQMLGYCLTGDVAQEMLFFLYGNGANGKSVLAGLMHFLLGDYAAVASPTLLMRRKADHGGPRPDIARLAGARLVIANETDEGQTLDEVTLKSLVSTGTITARGLYQAEREIALSGKILVLGNHRPAVRGTDDGIWRRLVPITMRRQFSEEERDYGLLDKLKTEADGILTLLVRGAMAVHQQGRLILPESIQRANAAYRHDSDLFAQWLDECCELIQGATTPSTLAYENYKWWCDENGTKPLGRKMFNLRLDAVGVVRTKETTKPERVILVGLRLSAGHGL